MSPFRLGAKTRKASIAGNAAASYTYIQRLRLREEGQQETMAIKFTDEMKELVNKALADQAPCFVTTASAKGEPGIGLRGSVMVFDDNHIAWWERAKRDGLQHIQENPRIVVMYRNTKFEVRKTWKIYASAKVYESGPIREQVMGRTVAAELGQDPERKGVAVVAEVDLITQGNNLLQAKDGFKLPDWVIPTPPPPPAPAAPPAQAAPAR